MISRVDHRAPILAVALCAVVLAACGSSSTPAGTGTTTAGASKSYVLKASLSPGADVPTPKGAAGATGTFTASLSVTGTKGSLGWVLSFSHLSGPALFAHIHVGPPGKAGPIAIALCGPCMSPNKSSYNGTISSKLLGALLHGDAYVNVHTKKNPAGEVRGQLSVTPNSVGGGPAPSSGPSSGSSSGGSAPSY